MKGCKLTAVVFSLYALSKTNAPKENIHVLALKRARLNGVSDLPCNKT